MDLICSPDIKDGGCRDNVEENDQTDLNSHITIYNVQLVVFSVQH